MRRGLELFNRAVDNRMVLVRVVAFITDKENKHDFFVSQSLPCCVSRLHHFF